MMLAAAGTFPVAVPRNRPAAQPAMAESDVQRHFSRRGHGEEFEMEVRWIMRQLPPSAGRILDIGCGNGSLLARLGLSRVVGVDYSPSGLRTTRQWLPHSRLACSDATKLPFAKGSFDAIMAQHLIEHITEPGSMLAEWRRVLCPGGVAIVVTPNAAFRDPAVFDDPTHVCLYDHRRLSKLFRENGFQVNQVRTLGCPWFRRYQSLPAGWRVRRMILGNAEPLSQFPLLRWLGQSLCCVARRSVR